MNSCSFRDGVEDFDDDGGRIDYFVDFAEDSLCLSHVRLDGIGLRAPTRGEEVSVFGLCAVHQTAQIAGIEHGLAAPGGCAEGILERLGAKKIEVFLLGLVVDEGFRERPLVENDLERIGLRFRVGVLVGSELLLSDRAVVAELAAIGGNAGVGKFVRKLTAALVHRKATLLGF
jgi:hypothetical protein